MPDWEMEMGSIEKMIAGEMNHPELCQWSSEPLDRSLIWLIWSMGASAGLGPALRAAVAAAVYLVHRGLEVHEVERAQPGGGGVSATTVLAGDFSAVNITCSWRSMGWSLWWACSRAECAG